MMQLQKKRVLVIEDNAGVAELIGEQLKDHGYDAIYAATGQKALEILNSTKVEMLILDYSLPDMDGKEIILRMQKDRKKIPPFIVSTGRGDEQLAVDMMKLGAYDYLIKDKTLIARLPEAVARLEKEIERAEQLERAQQALKESEERFRSFVEKASDFFVKLSPEGNFHYTSPNWEKHLGYTFAEISSDTIFPFIHPDDTGRLHNDLNAASLLENNQFAAEYRIKDIEGNWKTHAVKGYSVNENEIILINCIARDITDEKNTEKRLARAVFEAEENEKKGLAEHLHEGIGPLISAIKMSMGRIKSLKNIDEKGVKLIEYSDHLIDDAVSQVRNLANELMPNIINDFGLIAALRSQTKTINDTTDRQVIFDPRETITEPDKMIRIIAYRAISRLLQESLKSSSSGKIKITVQQINNRILLVYQDFNYLTFDPMQEKNISNIDLHNLKSKIESLDGMMHSTAGVSKTWTVHITLPSKL